LIINVNGIKKGVMKHVGESIKNAHLKPTDEKIVVLGIANWCTVADNHKLIRNKVSSSY